ncbi:MAG: CopG family transcriptional regulator [Lachnospiraceae bacterium]|nr:CopG family transcriptional regulator [Lachnospiraceae bacterium]
MATVSLRLSDEDYKLIREYVKTNNLNMSNFVRESVLYRIEDDLNLDEQRILAALKRSENEKRYTHQEVWDELGV